MKNEVKSRSILMLASMLLIAVVFCGCSSNGNAIVGRWEKTEGSGFDYLEFFSDGTYTSSHPNYAADYSIEGNRLRLTGVLMETKVYTFEIKSNVLNLLNDDGEIYASFEKAN